MLTLTSLPHAQADLVLHRVWLSTFLARRQQIRTFTSPCRRLDHFPTAYGVHRYSARPARSSGPRPESQSRQYASFKGKTQKIHRVKNVKLSVSSTPATPGLLGREDVDTLLALRQAVTDYDVKRVIPLFEEYVHQKGRMLYPPDTRNIAQCLHEALRRETRKSRDARRREDTDELVTFAEALVEAVVDGKAFPLANASVHLLAFFKDAGVRDAGVRYWSWLRMQDISHLHPDVYGLAMELLAMDGVPLAELEAIYSECLQRFPGSFHAYHFSPNAMLPNRDGRSGVYDISTFLLHGLLMSRLLAGDTRNAYMALDTTLRLLPTVTPPRFFSSCMAERPIAEAYTIFAMACRAGIVVPLDTVRPFLTAIRESWNSNTATARVLGLRQMLSAIYMYVGAGGRCTTNIINEFLIATTQVMRVDGMKKLDVQAKTPVVGATMQLIRKSLEIFARYGARPGISAFNSLITNLAGFGGAKQVIEVAIGDARSLGLEPNVVTRRSILTAAGTLGDSDLVRSAWQDLEEIKAGLKHQVDATDLHILTKAARLSGCEDFAETVFKQHLPNMPETDHEGLLNHLESPGPDLESENDIDLNVTAVLAELDKLSADLDVVEERTRSRHTVQDFGEQALPMVFLPDMVGDIMPESELRRLYDSLTTEQPTPEAVEKEENIPETAHTDADVDAQQSPAPVISAHSSPELKKGSGQLLGFSEKVVAPPASQQPTEPDVSTTNLTYGQLRYENWKSINHLLALSEKHDTAYAQIVDEAIAAGVAPPRKDAVSARLLGKEVEGYGMSDLSGIRNAAEGKAFDVAMVESGKRQILRLRGLASDGGD